LLKHRLIRLFHFSTYRLVRHDESHTQFGQTAKFHLPGGRFLYIEPKGMDVEMIKMEVMLFQGGEPMMTTDLEIMNHGIFMVGGPRYERGTLIISIEIDALRPTQVTATSTPVGPLPALPPSDR